MTVYKKRKFVQMRIQKEKHMKIQGADCHQQVKENDLRGSQLIQWTL